jgi:hypothetical protein
VFKVFKVQLCETRRLMNVQIAGFFEPSFLSKSSLDNDEVTFHNRNEKKVKDENNRSNRLHRSGLWWLRGVGGSAAVCGSGRGGEQSLSSCGGGGGEQLCASS